MTFVNDLLTQFSDAATYRIHGRLTLLFSSETLLYGSEWVFLDYSGKNTGFPPHHHRPADMLSSGGWIISLLSQDSQ